MSFETKWIRFGKDAKSSGFCAWPERAAAPLPAVIVIQEAWGVDGHIEDVTVRFAKAGYLALAPDLYANDGERPAPLVRPRLDAVKEFMNGLGPSAWSDAAARTEALARVPEPRRSELGQSFDMMLAVALAQLDAHVPRLQDAAEYLRSEHPLSRGAKVGAVGYCMGGGLAGRLACADPKLAAAVVYYGMAPPADRIANVACPVLGVYGGLDARINAGIADFAAAMEKHQKRFERHVYEGAQHAFFNDTRPSYHASASRDAFARTLEFLRRELSS
jgi:carboxymethylenebutenolidase